MAFGPITSWQINGETMETVTTLFSWAKKSPQIVTAPMKLKDACSVEAMTNLDSILKSRQRLKTFANKHLSSQSYGFSCSHVWMWELDHKES